MIEEKIINVLNRKSAWPVLPLVEICQIDPSKRELNGIDKNTMVSFGMMADLGGHKRTFNPIKTKSIKEIIKGGYSYFKENDVLVAKMTPCFENGKSGIAEKLKNGIGFGSTEFYVLRCGENVLPDWIYNIISSDKFLEQGKSSLVGTTGRRRLIKQYVESFAVVLPPIEEQEQIISLFKATNNAIEQIETQEENLKTLWKSLINQFVAEKPRFGNILKNAALKTVRYCEVTDKLTRRIQPLTYKIDRIVAGENLESEDFKIRTWQNIGDSYLGPAFHILFKEGDILYGSRRTYLRKVALADFDGVCANTTYVIRAKEEIILQALLKHIMLSEKFTQYSIGVSKGSTNPYINWKDLDNFSFQIPDIDIQKIIARILDDLINLIEQLKSQRENLKNLKQKLLNDILG